MNLSFAAYLANVPGLDVLQFNQKLVITACLELVYKYPAVSRLLNQKQIGDILKKEKQKEFNINISALCFSCLKFKKNQTVTIKE